MSVEVLPLPELFAEAPVPAVAAEAGRNQIAGPAQPLKSARIASHRDAKAKQLGE